MKRVKFLTWAIFAIVTMSACSDDYYTDGYEEKYVREFKVTKNQWKLIGEEDEVGSYYQYIYDKVPLNVSYYNGIVTAYMFLNYDSKYEVQTPLPYTEYMVDELLGGGEEHYSIQYSYDIKDDGTIAFKAHVSDFYTSLFNPGTQYFRVAIIW